MAVVAAADLFKANDIIALAGGNSNNLMISVRDKDRIDTEYRDFSNIHLITVYLESTFACALVD
jgi:hypothetical protein